MGAFLGGIALFAMFGILLFVPYLLPAVIILCLLGGLGYLAWLWLMVNSDGQS